MAHSTQSHTRFSVIAVASAMLAIFVVSPTMAGEPGEPGEATVHATIDEAALDALATLRSDRSPTTRQMRVGRILAVEGGFVWDAPARPTSGDRPVVRLTSGPDHVATFLARPRDGFSTDRAHEREWQRRERALVDVQDSRHRPLFVLTGAGRVVVYRNETQRPTRVEIAAR